jgi:hypothetical protein
MRMSELRIILEKLIIDWNVLLKSTKNGKLVDSLLNNTYKKAILYFSYFAEDNGKAAC